METKLITLVRNDKMSVIFCLLDADISEEYVSKIMDANQNFFEMIKSGGIQVSALKFEYRGSDIIMRSFSSTGHEAACYFVTEDNKLYLYNGNVDDAVVYCKNGLQVVGYDENNEGVMVYRMLDDNDLDPVGDSFTLTESILFSENYALVRGWQ